MKRKSKRKFLFTLTFSKFFDLTFDIEITYFKDKQFKNPKNIYSH